MRSTAARTDSGCAGRTRGGARRWRVTRKRRAWSALIWSVVIAADGRSFLTKTVRNPETASTGTRRC